MKKLKSLAIISLIIIFIATISKAAYSDVSMSVVEKPTARINFGTKSYAERSVISEDMEKKEITFQLKVVNEETGKKPTGEIMLVIDNSKSMLETANNSTKTREDLVINSAKTLVSNLLKDNDQLKIGAVSFSTTSEVANEGTSADAKVVSELTDNADTLNNAISTIEYDGPRTDLQAGLALAKTKFTDSTDKAHKYIIVLTDGVPNVALNYDKTYYSDDVINKTKTELQSLSSVTDNVYVMLTGITDGDKTATGSTKTYNQIIEEIFGTTEKPTIGKFYYVTDDKIEETITTEIYNNLAPSSYTFKDLELGDYFTDEIIKNFDFSYVKDPNYGTISSGIDPTTKSITWKIPELKEGETAITQYTLKLKENFDEGIINKVLNTHSDLEITYTDEETNTPDTKNSTVTPKVKLTENLPAVLPKAGDNIKYAALGVAGAVVVILGIRYAYIKNKLK